MTGTQSGIAGCSKLAALGLALVLAVGLSGCKSDKKTGVQTSTGSGGATAVTPAPPPASAPPSTPTPTPTTNAPTISGEPGVAKVSLPYSFKPTVTDPDGDAVTIEIVSLPGWATYDAATGSIAGTPPLGTTGTLADLQIVVSDGKVSTSMNFKISIVDPVTGEAVLAWQAPMTNDDGTTLTDLAGYVIRYGKNADKLDQSISIGDPKVTTVAIEKLVEGTWYFTLSAINSIGIESDPAGKLSKTIG